jgi:predicted RecA/RadA family phage recombinase
LFGWGGDACVAGQRSRILHHAVIDLAKAQADDVEEGKKRDAAISTAPQFRRSS